MHQYKSLKVWQKAFDLTVKVYALTEQFPDKERFGLISQINRSAISVVSNIAEGAGRNSDKEFRQILGITLGSSCELETQLLLANKLNYIPENKLEEVIFAIEEIQKMTFTLQKSLSKQINQN